MPKIHAGAFDPLSDRLVLRYVGDGRPIRAVPARDLTESDLCRLAYERALTAVAREVGQPIDPERPELGLVTRPDPRMPDQAAVAALRDELVDRGQFEPASTPPAEPAPVPVAPATTPEG